MNIFDIDLNELIIEVYQEFDSQLTQVQTVNVENYAPVQSVNGKIGWVVIDKNDVGLSNVENVSILGASGNIQNQINNLSGDTNANFYPRSNPSGFVTGVDLSSYATSSNLANTGSTLDTKINSLSGYVNSASSNIVYTTGNQTISGVKSFTNNVNITGDLILSGQYNVKTQIENTKKIAIAYAIAL